MKLLRRGFTYARLAEALWELHWRLKKILGGLVIVSQVAMDRPKRQGQRLAASTSYGSFDRLGGN